MFATSVYGAFYGFWYALDEGRHFVRIKISHAKIVAMTSVISRAVREVEQEIARLQQALNIVRSVSGTRARRGARRRPRKLSAEARKRIAAA
jgi:hypothetical protein